MPPDLTSHVSAQIFKSQHEMNSARDRLIKLRNAVCRKEHVIFQGTLILWRDVRGVLSECTIVRVMGRSAYRLEA